MEIAVKEAARRLGVDESRVRQMLRAGDLAGHRLGREWLVVAEDVARLESHRRVHGRPLGPKRAWGLLDLLGGGGAAWLSAVARSQVRASIQKLDGSDADRWRAALRGRSEMRRCEAHPAALQRLQGKQGVLRSGEDEAAGRAFDLVSADLPSARSPLDVRSPEQLYVHIDRWDGFARELAIRENSNRPNLVVRLPNEVWPFDDANRVADSVLAADLLESAEPRAVRAGEIRLNELAAAMRR